MTTTTSTPEAILDAVGGADNIVHLTHCATRLRFELRDASVIDKATVEAIPGVLGAVPQSGDRYQIVIGGAVQGMYTEIMNLPAMKNAAAVSDADVKAAARSKARGKNAIVDAFFEYLSDSFRPLLPVLLGTSLIIAGEAVLEAFHIIDTHAENLPPTLVFANAMFQSVFYFMPIMVAYNAAKKLGIDPWVGAAVMAALLTQDFAKLSDSASTVCSHNSLLDKDLCMVHIAGLPMQLNSYGGQVFVPLLMVAILAPLYKYLTKIIPANVQMVFVPFLCFIIMMPLTAFLIGPIGIWLGTGIGAGLFWLYSHVPFVFAIAIPLLYPFLVPLGLHWPLNAIMIANINGDATNHLDYIQGPMGAWNFACFGASAAVLAISIRDRDTEMRQTATGAVVAGLLGGISEPSLYGIHLRFKRIYPRMLIGCVVGGLIQGIGGGVVTHAFVFTSLLTIPAFSNIPLYAISVGAAFITAFIAVFLSDYRTPEQKAEAKERQARERAEHEVERIEHEARRTERGTGRVAAPAPAKTALEPGAVTRVLSPLAGRVIPLEEVPDPVFSAGTVGKGVGIEPTGTTVVAPGDGTIVVAQATGHAFGIKLDNGIELLIHVGIDTVNLEGRGFEVKVAKGDRVRAGDPLVTFDPKVITKAGYSLVTPVLVTNGRRFAEVTRLAEGEVNPGDAIFETKAKPPKEPRPVAG